MTKDEAIYLLRNTAWLASTGTLESVEEAVEMATEALKERPKGKWDRDREIPNTCSVCGEDWDKYVEGQIWYTGEIPNYCPNCGADMRGEK